MVNRRMFPLPDCSRLLKIDNGHSWCSKGEQGVYLSPFDGDYCLHCQQKKAIETSLGKEGK